MNDFIWIVSGHTGIYSARQTWMVAWHTDELAAKAHAREADEEAKKIVSSPEWDALDYDEQIAAVKTKLDPFRPRLYEDRCHYSTTKVERSKWPFPEPKGD